MWVEKQGNKYKACERYVDPMTGKTRKASVTIDKDTPKARKAAAEALRQKIAEIQEPKRDESITVKELVKLYEKHQESSVKPQTLNKDKSMLIGVTEVLGPDVLANNLSARYIIERLEKEKENNITRNTYLANIKKLLRWAYQNDYIETCAYLDKIPKWKDNQRGRIEDKYLTSEELKTLLDGMRIRKWKLLTHFLALSGLRIGEAMALLDTDVTDVITVNKTMDIGTGKISDSAKTDAGNREVYVQEELAPVIRAIRKEKNIDQIEKGYRTDRFLFEVGYNSYNTYLRKNSTRILNHEITPHALRHTHVSLLAENGVPLEVISRRVGHEGSDITKKIYLHITEKHKQADRDKVEKIRLLC